MKKILLPVDGSECSKATLEWATETLDKTRHEFVLLSIIADPMIAEYEVEDALRALKDTRAMAEKAGFTVSQSEYVVGDPVDSICRYAEEEGVDQILIGSHGRSGLAKLLMGSVSTGVLEKSKVPVFLYRNVACKPATV